MLPTIATSIIMQRGARFWHLKCLLLGNWSAGSPETGGQIHPRDQDSVWGSIASHSLLCHFLRVP